MAELHTLTELRGIFWAGSGSQKEGLMGVFFNDYKMLKLLLL